jgi:hypothetical protein
MATQQASLAAGKKLSIRKPMLRKVSLCQRCEASKSSRISQTVLGQVDCQRQIKTWMRE